MTFKGRVKRKKLQNESYSLWMDMLYRLSLANHVSHEACMYKQWCLQGRAYLDNAWVSLLYVSIMSLLQYYMQNSLFC